MTHCTNNDFIDGLAYALETLAFVCLAPAESIAPPPSAVLCTITCRGEVALRLSMIAPLELGHLIAANMLGTDSSDPQAVERAMDSLREVMNVACGTLCARVGGQSNLNIELDLPQSTLLTEPESTWATAISRFEAQILDADSHIVAAWLEVLT